VVSTMLITALVAWLGPPRLAEAAIVHPHSTRRVTSAVAPAVAKPHAPAGPPLGSIAPRAEAENAGVPSAEGDQLVENGLASPLCKDSASVALSSATQSNCKTSGFVGAPAPTNNYAIDVHIDVGAFGLSKGGLLSVIQDVFIAPVWNALVWVVHALVVLLEWCFTLELLDSATMGGVARSVRQVKASFTEPWLALVLSAASVLAAYNGLVRRRVTETLGQSLVTVAMMALGLWVIADPLGTLGAVGRWANQASIGTLGAVVQGTPANAPRTLADSMRAVFSDAIEMPWCYLEFGNVRWCSDPAQLDSGLREAALHIVAEQQSKLGCGASLAHQPCSSKRDAAAITLERTKALVREADTNGKLFLAFPANRSERNSVKEENSLLRVLCQGQDDTKCRGSAAAEAEFRSDVGTFPRMIGVVLIAVGVLGMTVLFGMVALRLLSAAIVSLFLLLLAPFATLAPAFGDSGRATFVGWATRLLGSVTSKLLFSFLLGALLSMQRILMSLELLGWWTQWLLMSAFWWAVFFKRHEAMAFLRSRGRESVGASHASVPKRIGRALETPRAMLRTAGRTKRRVLSSAPDSERLRKRVRVAGEMARERADPQTARILEHEHSAASASLQAEPRAQAHLSSRRAQLERVRGARETALAGGERRRATRLAVREQRIGAELTRGEKSLSNARRIAAEGEAVRRTSGITHTHEQRRQSARFLDEQAALPSARELRGSRRRRDYPALAPLAGYGREDYTRLEPRARRQVQLRIDRELAARSHSGVHAREVLNASPPQLGSRERGRVDTEFDRALEQRTFAGGSSLSGFPLRRPSTAPLAGESSESNERSPRSHNPPVHAREPRSRIMDDAREVASGRKRQLGREPVQ
jgi:hypothetical protein